MSISRFNPEGYYDPTTYEALSNIEAEERKARFRPVVYTETAWLCRVSFLCSPALRGQPERSNRNEQVLELGQE